MKKPNYTDVIKDLLKEDPRFAADAYAFVQEALAYTVKMLDGERARVRNISGPELLEGVRKYALEEYGPLAKTVLNTWGLPRCEDIGAVVFHLVDKGVLRKTDEDSPNDFANGYDFDTAFLKPFQQDTSKGKRKSPCRRTNTAT